MSIIFQEKITVAVLATTEDLRNKFKTLFLKKDDFLVEYFDKDEDLFKHIETNNVNVAFCDVEPFNKDKNLTQTLSRQVISLKRGTYLVALTDNIKLVNLTTLYRIGVNGLLYTNDSISDYKKELERAVNHINSWRGRFEQVLTDKSMERELDELFK